MAYSEEVKVRQIKILDPSKQSYRANNARITNSQRFPNSYLYILRLEGHDIYKVGVSNNPKRRINDLRSANPFNINVLFSKKFEEVYEIEKIIIDLYSHNAIKGEWFNAYEECVSGTIKLLNELQYMENGSRKRQ